jgi:hypothetical protein
MQIETFCTGRLGVVLGGGRARAEMDVMRGVGQEVTERLAHCGIDGSGR